MAVDSYARGPREVRCSSSERPRGAGKKNAARAAFLRKRAQVETEGERARKPAVARPEAAPAAAPRQPEPVAVVVPVEHCGSLLRKAREREGMTLAELALRTRIQEGYLQAIEEGRLDGLPAKVFLRGFVVAFARAVKADEDQAVRLLKLALAERERQVEPAPTTFTQVVEGRRRVGVALVVLLILIVAALMSLLLRRPVHEPLSYLGVPPTLVG